MPKHTVIIIVTYNGMPWLEKCLTSCQGYSVIVVDNCSTDGTVKFINTHFSKVKVLELSVNLGFGKANNLGIRKALEEEADSVFLLNQDAYLDNDTISVLKEASKTNSKYGVLSPIHLNGKGDKLDSNFSNFMSYQCNPKFYSDAIFGRLKGIYEVPFVNAAAWFIPKRTLLEIGGFDPLFFHYAEDDHYCQRLKYHSFKIGVVSNVYVRHDREDRVKENIEVFSEKFFLYEERIFKSRIADINDKDYFKKWKYIKRTNYKNLLLSLMSLNFSKFLNYLKLFKLQKLWFIECEKSRNQVVGISSHYL